MSGNELRRLDYSTCIAPAQANERGGTCVPDSPLGEEKSRNILRLHEQRGLTVDEIARYTYRGTLPNVAAPTSNPFDGSETPEARVRDRFEAFKVHVRDVIVEAGCVPNE